MTQHSKFRTKRSNNENTHQNEYSITPHLFKYPNCSSKSNQLGRTSSKLKKGMNLKESLFLSDLMLKIHILRFM